MSNNIQILKQFQEKFKFSEFHKYELQQLSKKLDQLAQINFDSHIFDPIIKAQILDFVPITYDKKIILRDFVSTIQKIFEILSEYIHQAQKNIETSLENITVHKENIQIIEQFTNDRQYLCHVFLLPIKPRSKYIRNLQDQELSQYKQSQTLKGALIILLIGMVLQVIMMLTSSRFINCLVYCLGLGVFILNFFDKSYIRVCILSFFISLIFDGLWCLKNLNLNSVENSFDLKIGILTQLKMIFLKIIFVITILLMVAKLLLAMIFLRFRNNSILTKRLVKLWDLKIVLDAKISVSPISKILTKDHSNKGNQIV